MKELVENLEAQFDRFYGSRDWEIDNISVSGTVKYILLYLKHHERFPGRILDIGCGKGHFSMAFAEHSTAQVVGVDLSGEAIAGAKANYNHPHLSFMKRDILRDGIPAKVPYDLIYIRGLSLLNQKKAAKPDVHETLRHIFRFLAPEGVMAIDEWTDLSGTIKPDGYLKGWHQRTEEEIQEGFYVDIFGCNVIDIHFHPVWNTNQVGYTIFYYRG